MNAHEIAAAEWFVRVQNDDLSAEEIGEWQQWLGEHPHHRAAFDRVQHLWEGFEGLPNKQLPAMRTVAAASKPWTRWMPAAAAAGILAIVAGVMAYRSAQSPSHSAAETSLAFETRSGEHHETTLPDGSRLALGARSVANVRFSPGSRAVALNRGEAFFSIAKDAHRPFVVRAGNATITALGTAFNVRRLGDRVQVMVTQGSVKAELDDGAPTVISAGQQVTLDRATRMPMVQSAPSGVATSWRSGRLEYLNEPLKDVVSDVNRYSRVRISIGDARVGNFRLTGTVFEDDIEGWVKSVEDLLPVRVERKSEGEIVIQGR